MNKYSTWMAENTLTKGAGYYKTKAEANYHVEITAHRTATIELVRNKGQTVKDQPGKTLPSDKLWDIRNEEIILNSRLTDEETLREKGQDYLTDVKPYKVPICTKCEKGKMIRVDLDKGERKWGWIRCSKCSHSEPRREQPHQTDEEATQAEYRKIYNIVKERYHIKPITVYVP